MRQVLQVRDSARDGVRADESRSDPAPRLSAVDVARTVTAAVTRDGEWYVARCLEVEVTSQGETIDEVPTTFAHPLMTPIEIRVSA